MTEQDKHPKKISRRGFITTAGIALGAGVLACGGTAYFGLKTPASVEFPQSFCGGEGRKVLLAYASKCGATAETAEFISRRLCERGCAVDLMPARLVRSLAGYQAVILGSACYMGKLLGEALDFAAEYLAAASDLPVALFSLSLTAREKSGEKIQEALAYFDPLRQYFTPAAVAAFPGRIDYATLPFLYRAFAQVDEQGILAEGDFRDWDAVSTWTDTLPFAKNV